MRVRRWNEGAGEELRFRFLGFLVNFGASARSSSGILSEFRVSELRDAASDVSVGFVLLVVLDGVLAAEMHELGV